jgi:deazaflavin-dependent oxidoreductase (nitroreductase family)
VSDWNTNIIEEFRANEGRVGGPFEGAPMIIVHSTGAKSGAERVNPLIYFPQDDGSMVIVASAAGAKTNPAWYHNLKANPETEVEVGTETFAVRAAEIEEPERAALWKGITSANAGFAAYEEQAAPRVIPLFRLTRA